MNKKSILISSGTLVSFVYLFLYFLGFRRGNEILLYVLSFLLSFLHGFVYTPMFVNCFELREYFQAKTGEDRNGSIQGIRGALPSLANALQVAFFYLFLSSSGLMKANEEIASYEAYKASCGCLGPDYDLNLEVLSRIPVSSKNIYLSSMTFLPLLLTLVGIVCTVLFVKVNDERFYCKCLMEIKERERA